MRVVRYRASSGPIRDAPEEVACRWVGLLETCVVVDRNFGGVPARHPDRLIKWFIEVVLLGVGVNLLSSYVVARRTGPGFRQHALSRRCWSLCRVLVFCAGSVMAQRGLGPWLCSH